MFQSVKKRVHFRITVAPSRTDIVRSHSTPPTVSANQSTVQVQPPPRLVPPIAPSTPVLHPSEDRILSAFAFYRSGIKYTEEDQLPLLELLQYRVMLKRDALQL